MLGLKEMMGGDGKNMVSNPELKARVFGIGMVNPKYRFKKLEIKDIPVMITQDGKLLCIPATDEVKHIGIFGMTGCQPAGSKVLMANGSWKNIEDVDEGDLILSPQEDGNNLFSKVESITKWFSNENYSVHDKRDNLLYKCSHNHLIPIFNDKKELLFHKKAREVDNSIKNYSLIKDSSKDGKHTYLIEINIKESTPAMVYGFEIDSPSKWYITDNYMVTHNTCKSVFMNSLLSWDYWHLHRGCINFNDFQKETFEWSMPADSFLHLLNRINVKPCGKPMVYVFPSTKTLVIENKDKRFPVIRITLPIEEVIDNIEYYHDLDKSKLYLGNIKEELKECHSMSEIRDVLQENFPDKGQGGMRFKLLNVFDSLFKNQILNVAVREAPAFLEYQDKFGNNYYNTTVQTLVRAGFIPSIQTSDLRNYEYFSAYMAFLAESIYRTQYDDPYFRKQTISLFVDEIDKLFLGHKGELVKAALNLFGTNGRVARVGLRWSTQHYENIPDQIRSNTKVLLVSRLPDAKAISHVRKDFNIPKSMENEILNLISDPVKGIFEVVALTTEKFVLYDLLNGTIKTTSEAYKGYLIPPMSRHKVPNKPL